MRTPLSEAERELLETYFGYIATLVEDSDASSEDKHAWQQLKNVQHAEHILNREDFYFREGIITVVGQVPAD